MRKLTGKEALEFIEMVIEGEEIDLRECGSAQDIIEALGKWGEGPNDMLTWTLPGEGEHGMTVEDLLVREMVEIDAELALRAGPPCHHCGEPLDRSEQVAWRNGFHRECQGRE